MLIGLNIFLYLEKQIDVFNLIRILIINDENLYYLLSINQ